MKARKKAAVFGFRASTSTLFPKHVVCVDSDGLLRQKIARLAKRLDAQPDQIECACKFEYVNSSALADDR
jgi:hypothetical protein